MTAKTAKAVRDVFRTKLLSIYGTWHACGLAVAQRGMKKGRLCDDCLEMVEAYLTDAMNELGARK